MWQVMFSNAFADCNYHDALQDKINSQHKIQNESLPLEDKFVS